MTDKQLINTLRNIKDYCVSPHCKVCKFYMEKEEGDNVIEYCQIKQLAFYLESVSPVYWNIDRIEEIIND